MVSGRREQVGVALTSPFSLRQQAADADPQQQTADDYLEGWHEQQAGEGTQQQMIRWRRDASEDRRLFKSRKVPGRRGDDCCRRPGVISMATIC